MYYIMKALVRWIKRKLGLRTFPPRRYAQLLQEIDTLHPRTILEIGTNDGINAAYLCQRASQYRDDVEYFGFDLFESMDDATFLHEFALATIAREKVDQFLGRKGVLRRQLFAGNTIETLRSKRAQLPQMDLVFIDGGHSQETVASDWMNVQELLHPKSVVFFDDYPNFGVGVVVDAIDREQWEVNIMPIKDVYPIDPHFKSGSKSEMMSLTFARVQPRVTQIRSS